MIASVSRTLDNFFVKTCVIVKRVITNIKKISNEKDCDTENNTKNQKDRNLDIYTYFRNY